MGQLSHGIEVATIVTVPAGVPGRGNAHSNLVMFGALAVSLPLQVAGRSSTDARSRSAVPQQALRALNSAGQPQLCSQQFRSGACGTTENTVKPCANKTQAASIVVTATVRIRATT